MEKQRASVGFDVLGNFWESHAPGSSVNQGDAIKEKSGGKRPEDQIFDAGLQRRRLVSKEAGQNVKNDGHQLQRNKYHDKVVCRRGEHHSGQRKNCQDVKLGNSRRNSRSKVNGKQKDGNGRQKKQLFEEESEMVLRKHAVEYELRRFRQVDEERAGKDRPQPGDGKIANAEGLAGRRRP